MGRYEVVYIGRSLSKSSKDQWQRAVENIDGKIEYPITKKGTTLGFVVDTSNVIRNE